MDHLEAGAGSREERGEPAVVAAPLVLGVVEEENVRDLEEPDAVGLLELRARSSHSAVSFAFLLRGHSARESARSMLRSSSAGSSAQRSAARTPQHAPRGASGSPRAS